MEVNIIDKIKENNRENAKFFANLEPANVIAQYMTGFANTEGGTIVFGVKDSYDSFLK
jgi:predicted HTH transcriptional regulator